MILNKICFQWNSQMEADDCRKMITLCLPLGSLTVTAPSEGVLELEFDKNAGDLQLVGTRAKKIYDCLTSVGGWQVVGPRCLGSGLLDAPNHERRDRHMEFAVAPGHPNGLWRCLLPGCMQTLEYVDAIYMTFRDFSALVHRGSNQLSVKPTTDIDVNVDKLLPDYMRPLRQATKTIAFDDRQRSLEAMAASNHSLLKQVQALETDLERSKNDSKKLLGEFRQDYDKLSNKLNGANERVHELKDLPTAADAMFRFLAGIGFQDRPVSDQRQFLELMSKLKDALRRAGIGSWD